MIELRGVTKDYPLGASVYRALRGVDLRIAEGESVAITGASGSGKSTLMHIIGALHRVTSGHALLDGQDLGVLSADRLARLRNEKIGFVFQRFFLLPKATAAENVELPMVYAGLRIRERRQRAEEALEQVGLLDHARHDSAQLSGGEAQRVAIARALVNHPRLLLCDEPTGNLDSGTTQEILDIFGRLHRVGMTLVVVTHESDVAARQRREIVLKDGMIEEDRDVAA